jgi:integrase
MGRKRAGGDPFELSGTRLAYKRGKFWYRHRATSDRPERWEDVGTDLAEAKKRAKLYNDPQGNYGTLAYWFAMFLADCEARVKAKDLAQRTLDDYRTYRNELEPTFGRMFPEQVTPHHVQTWIDEGRKDSRATQANRERAFMSSCFSWLLRRADCPPGLKVNPCMRRSGVKRNTERKRERYVTHEEYRAVYNAGGPKVRLMMELVYRTLQRPEVDVLAWTPANIRAKGDGKVLRFTQSKTGKQVDIALVGDFEQLVKAAIGEIPALHQPLVHTLKGEAYTYDGISTMLKKAQAKVRAEHKAKGGPLASMPSFGYRDLKGKGATDMWLSGVPIERIQLLCGHEDKATTEKYIKARWSETAMPNEVRL